MKKVKTAAGIRQKRLLVVLPPRPHELQRQLQLLLQRQFQLQLLLELLLGATDHVLFFKKNADLCQNGGT